MPGLSNKSPPERSKIAMDRGDDVKYWAKHFQITKDELQRVVGKVGNAAAAVRKELESLKGRR